jgi:A/G-specific adenine glycosylase
VLVDIEVNEFLEFNETAIIHKLSHQHLHAKFWILKTNSDFKDKISVEKLKQFPVPVLIADFINAFKI